MKASSLWLGGAILRGIESDRPEHHRLFDDPLSLDLLPPLWRGVLRLLTAAGLLNALLALRERQYPGVMGNLWCRTRYIDDVLRDALDDGIDQAVILGAGFDTRPYRIAGIEQIHVFEVDHPATQARKQARLRQALGTLPPHVTFVQIDFDREKLDRVMPAAGFRSGRKTFFIWEGVTQYITAEAVEATLQYVSRNAAPESKIVFTYIRRAIVDGSSRSAMEQKLMSLTRRVGVPWIFGLDPTEVRDYLSARGLDLVEEVGTGRKLNVFEGERVVLAWSRGSG
jgi:methyltransferase (TIGR00027 family)